MKSFLVLGRLFSFLLFFTGTITAQVTSDYDQSTDFKQYNTYQIMGWEQGSDQLLTDFDKERILTALEDELNQRGIPLVESNGDIGVTLYLVLDQKTSTTGYTSYNGGMGYGARPWGWGMGSTTTTYSEQDYQEGTFVLDFYDQAAKELIWQGVIRGVVNENPKKREKSIPKKMKKLMNKYPLEPLN